MHDAGARLVVLLLGDPHLLEGAERGEDRTANPDRVLPLRGRDQAKREKEPDLSNSGRFVGKRLNGTQWNGMEARGQILPSRHFAQKHDTRRTGAGRPPKKGQEAYPQPPAPPPLVRLKDELRCDETRLTFLFVKMEDGYGLNGEMFRGGSRVLGGFLVVLIWISQEM